MCLPRHKTVPSPKFELSVNLYLDRISYSGPRPVEPTLDNLNKLMIAHLYTVPFENLDLHMQKPATINGEIDKFPIKLPVQKSYEKIVLNHRGGFCMELNPLFCALLQKIGFEAYHTDFPMYKKETDCWTDKHMATIVELEGKLFAVDVGMGNPAAAPLLLEPGHEQSSDNGYVYCITKSDEFFVIHRKTPQEADLNAVSFSWDTLVKCRPFAYDLGYWSKTIEDVQTPECGPFLKHPFLCLLSRTERHTLADLRYVVTPMPFGERYERLLSVDEYYEVLKSVFGISFDGCIVKFSNGKEDPFWTNSFNSPSDIQ